MSGITVATFGKRRLLVCFSLSHFISTIRHALLTIQLYSVTFNLLLCFVLPENPIFRISLAFLSFQTLTNATRHSHAKTTVFVRITRGHIIVTV